MTLSIAGVRPQVIDGKGDSSSGWGGMCRPGVTKRAHATVRPIRLQAVDLHHPLIRVNDPVLPYSGVAVKVKFSSAVVKPAVGRDSPDTCTIPSFPQRSWFQLYLVDRAAPIDAQLRTVAPRGVSPHLRDGTSISSLSHPSMMTPRFAPVWNSSVRFSHSSVIKSSISSRRRFPLLKHRRRRSVSQVRAQGVPL